MNKPLIPAAGVCLMLSIAAAQEASGPPDEAKQAQGLHHEVVVTAARLETPLKETADSVTVITGDELRRTGKTGLAEALAAVPGTNLVRAGGRGGLSSLMIRGANSEHTLVLLDGLELNDPINPGRSFDLAHINLADVARVEVLRGPQSTLYGSDAMGGVINIITKRGGAGNTADLYVSAGSYGTASAAAGFSAASGRLSYAVTAALEATAGVSAASDAYPGNSEADGSSGATLSVNLGYETKPGAALSFLLRSVISRTEIDAFGGPYGDDPNDVERYRNVAARLAFSSFPVKKTWEQRLSVEATGSSRQLDNPADEAYVSESERGRFSSSLLKLGWQNNFYVRPWLTLSAGAELERERGGSEYAYVSEWGVDESRLPATSSASAGAYCQVRVAARERFFMTAGARFDRHSRAGSAGTFRVSPMYVLRPWGTRVKAALGTAFKAPTLYQLFAPPTSWGPIGNPDLKPERLTGWEVGFEQPFFSGSSSASVTLFSNRFRELIDFDFEAGYVNLGRARTSGVETSLEVRPSRQFGLRMSYTTLDARDAGTGQALLRRPKHKLSTEVYGRLFGRYDTSVALLAVGRRPDRDFSSFPYSTVDLPAYRLVDISISGPLAGRLGFIVRLENIFNARYETVWGYGAPGFTASFGLRAGLPLGPRD